MDSYRRTMKSLLLDKLSAFMNYFILRLKAELDSLLAELESAKNLLQENQIERDLLEKQLKQQQSSSDTNGHVNDIHRLRDQLTCSTDPVTGDSTCDVL